MGSVWETFCKIIHGSVHTIAEVVLAALAVAAGA